jgi:hypothetical protein
MPAQLSTRPHFFSIPSEPAVRDYDASGKSMGHSHCYQYQALAESYQSIHGSAGFIRVQPTGRICHLIGSDVTIYRVIYEGDNYTLLTILKLPSCASKDNKTPAGFANCRYLFPELPCANRDSLVLEVCQINGSKYLSWMGISLLTVSSADLTAWSDNVTPDVSRVLLIYISQKQDSAVCRPLHATVKPMPYGTQPGDFDNAGCHP